MSTVYLVTKGEYSDYRVHGVFSTLEKAEYAKKLWAADNISERELDGLPETPPGMFLWSVQMDDRGNVVEAEIVTPGHSEPNWFRSRYGGDHFFRMWAETKDVAIKIAGDRRRWIIANQSRLVYEDPPWFEYIGGLNGN